MFLPENIDLAHSEKYNLSIRLTPNGFSFCIYNPSDLSVFNFQKTELSTSLSKFENIKKLIFDFGFFSQTFNETSVTIVSSDFIIIPDIYFDEKKKNEIFNFNFQDNEDDVMNQTLSNSNSHILYRMDKDINSFLIRHLSNPIFNHYVLYLINLFRDYYSDSDRKRSFVDFHKDRITVICFEGSKLLSANTFEVSNEIEASYFILNVWEKLKFDQFKDLLFFSGEIELNKTITNELEELISNTNKVVLKPTISIPDNQVKLIPTDLMIKLCE